MREFSDLDDFLAATGRPLGVSDWVTIEQERIDLFADATGDHQWIHTSPAEAASGPYGSTIAHGYLTLSLLPSLVAQIFRVNGVRMAINYGLNKVRFITPVKVGSMVRANTELLDTKVVDPATVQYVLKTTVEIGDATRPACIAETIGRYYR
ncbi:MaoC family dehydratase [Mycobacterium sp. CVI_P3]|uniref:MaoC family dehydratase n=1 Tax=Mycobacterium pinniadriaticum TaxID=2994102 RepID=A0ABT3SPU4_9MYCO|nr:MaoC family dehydratase [Mycobacterium pinniadriaticum]MCX2934414.1 MaoC family dehydratase [Mycobacterium pinniadriaticum]MCX2940837.1 MaoC family dehydratase [Mycobacterium pinniadriaticum]